MFSLKLTDDEQLKSYNSFLMDWKPNFVIVSNPGAEEKKTTEKPCAPRVNKT